jgi:geranylgeranyl diphosphate synthase type I
VWSLWGESSAILAGDALLALATEVLLDGGGRHAAAATRELMAATRELIRGQVDDLSFESRTSVTLEECLAMADGKTGSLLAASTCIGAQLAGAPTETVAALRDHGRHLGAAFQLVDDLLGIWGDPAATGKPVLSDLRARKKTLPVTYVLCRGGAPGRALADWYATDPAPGGDREEDLRRIAAVVSDGGGRAWAESEADEHLRRADAALARVTLPAGPRAELTELGRFLIRRVS